MISIKDYAKQNHITYEAVRQQIKRFRDQLDDHIIQDGRTQYLDDIAVAFLDERRQKNPVVVYQQSKDEAIETMRLKLEGAYEKIAAQAVMITDLQQFKIDAMEQRYQLEDAKAAQERRERELQAREDEFTQELAAARQEAAEAAKKAADERAAQFLGKVFETHRKERTAAQGRERELREYLVALEAWNALKWHQRRNKKKHPKPAAPEWVKED